MRERGRSVYNHNASYAAIILFICVISLCFSSLVLAASPGAIIINGQRTIPLGWYAMHESPPFIPHLGLDPLYDANKYGFDFVMPYFPFTQGDAPVLSYLDKAHLLGVKVMIDLHPADVAEIARRVNLVKNHPALYGYYLEDEPEKRGITAATIIEKYQTVKANDPNPNHPVQLTLAERPENYTAYLQGGDIIGQELYTLSYIKDRVPSGVAAVTNAGKGYLSLPRAFDTVPTPTQFRYYVFGSIAGGAGGIMPFIFEGWVPPEGHAEPADGWRDTVIYPATNQLRLIRSTLAKGNVGLAAVKTGSSDIAWVLAGDAQDAVLVAVNHSQYFSRNGIIFTVVGLNPSNLTAEVVGENRSIATVNGQFIDNFSPLGVHIYRFNLTPPVVTPVATPASDIETGFKIYSNPSGNWSYGQRATLTGTAFTPFTEPQYYRPNTWFLYSDSADVLMAWAPSLGSWAGVSKFIKTPSSVGWTFKESTDAGDIELAADGANVTVARWTASCAHTYRIDGHFAIDDTRVSGITQGVAVLSNGVSLGSGVLAEHEDHYWYSGTVYLSEGDTVEFATHGSPYGVGLDAWIDIATPASDIQAGFNIDSNPWGGFSFGQRAAPTGTDFTAFTVPQYYAPNSWSLVESSFDVVRAWAPDFESWGGVYRYDQTPGSVGWDWKPDTVAGDMELTANGANTTVARWTANSAHLYSIDAHFEIDNTDLSGLSQGVLVLANGVSRGSAVLTGDADRYWYSGSVHLNAGDTIEFATYGSPYPVGLDAWIDIVAPSDLGAGFNIDSNPSDNWSYGQRATVEGPAFSAFTVPQYYRPNTWHLDSDPGDVLMAWAPGLGSWGGVTQYVQTPSSVGWAFKETTVAGDMELSANGTNVTVARWTAPSANLYSIDTRFEFDDTRQSGLTQGVVVLSKGISLGSDVLTGHGDRYWYSGTVDLDAGDTIEFATYGSPYGVGLDTWIGVITQPCPTADLTGDCVVDLADLLVLAQQWLTGNRI